MKGAQFFEFGDRRIKCRSASESTFGLLACPNCGLKHGRVAWALSVDADLPAGRAFYATYSPDEAREIAATLIEYADDIDAAKKRHLQ